MHDCVQQTVVVVFAGFRGGMPIVCVVIAVRRMWNRAFMAKRMHFAQ